MCCFNCIISICIKVLFNQLVIFLGMKSANEREIKLNFLMDIKMKKVFTAITSLALASAVQATPLTLDFNSGVTVGSGNVITSYTEDGFTLVADLAGNHFDDNYGGGAMGLHNGLDNLFYQNTLTLSYGGGAFDLLDIDLSYFHKNALLELTNSNGSRFIGFALGVQDVNFYDVTSVSFLISDTEGTPNGGVAWDSITVDIPSAGTSIPEPTSVALLGLALAGIGFSRKKKSS